MHADLGLWRCNTLGQQARFVRAPLVTGQPSWELNTFGRMTFKLALTDPDAQHVWKFDEVVLYYKDTPIWWGVVIARETIIDETGAWIEFRCADLVWYFADRFVGKASRTNYAVDWNFEANAGDVDYPAWAVVGSGAFTRDATRYKLHNRSAKLVSASAGQDWFIYEDILGFVSTGVGDLLTVFGWAFIEDDGTFTGPALGTFGIGLWSYYPGGGLAPEQPAVAHIDGSATGQTPRGTWVPLLATMWLPPSVTRDLQLRCYFVGGTIRWAAIQVVRMESLAYNFSATNPAGYDQGQIMGALVEHAQDPAVGKDDVNIANGSTATGVLRDRYYQFADHANILQALQEYPAMNDGCDFWVDWTPPAVAGGAWTRTFRTATHKGVARGNDYKVGPFVKGCKRWRHLDDGDQGISSITVLGFGDGPAREEAGVIDTSGTGGRIVEAVMSAPLGTDIDILTGVAQQEFDVRSHPDVWEATMYRPEWIGVLAIGDTTPVAYSVAGDATYQAPARVVSMTLNTETLALELTMNRPT